MIVPSLEWFTRVNHNKVLVISSVCVVFGFVFAGFLMPKMIEYGLKKNLRLTPETVTRQMFEKIPFPIDFRVYLFNVTNKDEVMNEEKPKLQEVGPYYFEEFKDKYDIVDNEEDDTIEYEYRNTYFYKPEKNSPGLTGDEIVTVAHPLILAMAMAVNVDKKELLSFIEKAINGLFNNPKDIFYTGSVWDLLYGGIIIDCSSSMFQVSAVCSAMDGGDFAEIRRINENAFNFSLFGNTNGTSIGRFTSLRGKKSILDVGRVLKYNEFTEMDAWYEEQCNQINGTDGTIFPPFHDKTHEYTIFVPQFCRSMPVYYTGSSEYAGIRTNRYTMGYDTTQYGERNCYCRPDKCPPEGILDLFPCAGTPVAVSAPHFLKVDPSTAAKVKGLNPDQDKHEFFMHFYQYAGAPISALGRGQINIEVTPIPEIPMMSKLQPMYLPLMWIEDGVDLAPKYTNPIKYQLIVARRFQRLLHFVSVFFGVCGLIFGSILYYLRLDEEDNRTRPLTGFEQNNNSVQRIKPIEVIGSE